LRTEPFSEDELGDDAFLGGRLVVAQPLKGYRAGIDPVCWRPASRRIGGQSVLDLGCGSGIVALCLGGAGCRD